MAGKSSSAPWIAASGATVAVTWAAAAGGKSDIFVAMSRDGGATFAAPVQVNTVAGDGRVGGEIPPRVALRVRAGAAPDVVGAWNAKDQGTEIKIARSADGGATFSPPVSLQAAGAAGDRGWHSLTLDDDGVAHVLWLDHRGLAKPAGDHAAHTMDAAAEDGVAMAQKSSLYYAALGARPGAERAITPGVCYCCKSAIVALPGGRLVSAWRHVYADNMRDIAFTVSRDGGRTFAAPARVSQDGWSINGCPDDGPALAAGADARVHIVWPTVIPGPEPMGALFYAAMRDDTGFTARTRIPTLGAPKPSHPQVVAAGAGRVVAAWDESVGGVRSAAYSVGERHADGSVRFAPATRLAAGGGPSSYPVMAVTNRGVLAAWTSGAPGASVIQVRPIAAPGSGPTAVR
ncbi:MAG: exo-alpha-sialidase [Acidobacteria bacterium]|nr:exo-alpha-sialidase [Acidobacteriota bacterium]